MPELAGVVGDVKTPADIKKKWKRLCCCGVCWILIGIVVAVVGILLMVFFVNYWNDETRWERGLGYTGVGFLVLAILMAAVGIIISCILCFIVRKFDRKRTFTPPPAGGAGLYPTQPPAQTAAQTVPSAPPTAGSDNKAADIEMIQPQIKDKTF